MIAFLRGTLVAREADGVVVEVQGVGYRLFLSSTSLGSLPAAGEEVKLFTELHVREDALVLYGFATAEERRFFRLLTGVNGVGPKVALAILSQLDPRALHQAVMLEDVAALARAPGVGKKTAQRVVLELRDKLGEPVGSEEDWRPALQGAPADPWSETLLALQNLGYPGSEAARLVEGLRRQWRQEENAGEPRAEELLRRALAGLGQDRATGGSRR